MSAWVGNLINWFVGIFLMYIWLILGNLFGLFGMWQIPHDNLLGIVNSLKMSEISKSQLSSMSIG